MRILSGIQPSGDLHVGNYFGMMQPALALQELGQALYFIADYHSLTSVQDPALLRRYVRGVATTFLACGLDPERTIFFRQSDRPEVAELTWILSTVTPMGLLERCHSFKDKTARGLAASHGLFAYPVLMAADILLYDAELVPVGRDQKQHLEVARDIAIKFNLLYGDTLVVPEASIRESTAVVPGTDGQKMSKSYQNTLPLFEEEAVLRKKIMGIVMDSRRPEEPKPDADQNTALQLLKLVAPESVYLDFRDRLTRGGLGYGDLKKQLFASVLEYFAPYCDRYHALAKDPDYVEDVLRTGATKALAIARPVLDRVRKACGLC